MAVKMSDLHSETNQSISQCDSDISVQVIAMTLEHCMPGEQ